MHFIYSIFKVFSPPSMLHSIIIGYATYVLLALGALYAFLLVKPTPENILHQGIVILGFLGIWRYSWLSYNQVRAFCYRYWVFPKLRRAANTYLQQHPAPPLYIVITAYQMPTAVFTECFTALFTQAAQYPQNTHIFAAVTDAEECQHLEKLFQEIAPNAAISLHLHIQEGLGKRAALATCLRAIARQLPQDNANIIFMDGDTKLQNGTLCAVQGFLEQDESLGAVTIHNKAICYGTPLQQQWYDLRLAQRHVMLASQSLSERLLVLTGRFSMFKAKVALHPNFIAAVEKDSLQHWRYGSFPLISGDDKSTWYYLAKHRFKMLYIPDVQIQCLEIPLHNNLLRHSIPLLQRWFGNMLCNNSRGLQLGLSRLPIHTWWSLVDQRLSMWTALAAPTACFLLSIAISPWIFTAYLVWVLCSRFIQGLLLSCWQKKAAPLFPFLLMYDQYIGACIKIHTLFRLRRQRWNRQKMATAYPSLKLGQEAIAYWFEITATLTFIYCIGHILLWQNNL